MSLPPPLTNVIQNGFPGFSVRAAGSSKKIFDALDENVAVAHLRAGPSAALDFAASLADFGCLRRAHQKVKRRLQAPAGDAKIMNRIRIISAQNPWFQAHHPIQSSQRQLPQPVPD